MARHNAVQQKLPCLLEISVSEGNSKKRPDQSFRVEATDALCDEASKHDLDQAWVSEKVDGTCCHVNDFQGGLLIEKGCTSPNTESKRLQ